MSHASCAPLRGHTSHAVYQAPRDSSLDHDMQFPVCIWAWGMEVPVLLQNSLDGLLDVGE